MVVAQLSAWGATGPWAGRRGFDSLVQVATGIAHIEGGKDRPGALPAQALDHGTGYLLAAGVLRAVADQADEGGSRSVRVALARTARELVASGSGDAVHGGEVPAAPWLAERDSPLGRLRYALPPVEFVGGPRDWARGPGVWGADAARWL